MNENHLPPELAALEADLRQQSQPELPAALRSRLLAAMQQTARAPSTTGPDAVALPVRTSLAVNTSAAGSWGWFVAGAACLAVLGLNLSLVAAREVGEGWETATPFSALSEAEAELQALVPELSPTATRAYALTLWSAQQSPLYGVPTKGKPGAPLFEQH